VSDWLDEPTTEARLGELDEFLRGWVGFSSSRLGAIALHLIGRGGKRLRPALLFLCGSGAPDRDENLRAGAAALELLHVASLYHDDVMDRAETRRGGPSVNAVWGNAMAATGGIYLLSRAMSLLATLPAVAQAHVAVATAEISTGQLREAENSYNLNLTEAEHLQIIGLKTGTLFELPCRLGGELAGAPPATVEALAAYGRNLGLAFQLADDALDLAGHSARLGKPVGADIREGVYSLPILRVLQREARDRPLATLIGRAQLSPDEVAAAIAIVRESGAINEALALAATYSDRAIAALDPLPRTSAHRSLVNLARYAVERDL